MFDARPRSRELIYILLAQRAARALGDLRMHANLAGIIETDARMIAKARLDAVVAVHMYGLNVADMEAILGDFRALAHREERAYGEFRTRRLVLAEVKRELAVSSGLS